MYQKEDDGRAPAIAPGLADSLSGLLRQAVEDVQAVSKMPGYVLNMGVWHNFLGGTCYVCMAGAVMTCRLGMPKYAIYAPDDSKPSIQRKMLAINEMRAGSFGVAFTYLSGDDPPDAQKPVLYQAHMLVITHFSKEFSHAPWEIYLKAAGMLEGAGL